MSPSVLLRQGSLYLRHGLRKGKRSKFTALERLLEKLNGSECYFQEYDRTGLPSVTMRRLEVVRAKSISPSRKW